MDEVLDISTWIPMLVMRYLNCLQLILPLPEMSSALNVILTVSRSCPASIRPAIIEQNSGNSIVPLLSVSNCITHSIFLSTLHIPAVPAAGLVSPR